jgi:hypothetical protein
MSSTRYNGELTKRVRLRAISGLGITNSNHEFSRATTLASSGRQGNLEDRGLAITLGRGWVSIASNEGGEVDDSIGLVSQRKSCAGHQAEKLGVCKDNVDRSVVCSKPAFVAVTLLARKQVVVVLELHKVLAHVVRGPWFITGQGSNVVEVWAVRVNRDQSIVGSAASKSTGTRVKSTLHFRTGGRVETGVETAIRSLVAGLEVTSLTLILSVMPDKKVPSKTGIFWDFGVISRDSVVDIGALVVSSFNEQSLVASES